MIDKLKNREVKALGAIVEGKTIKETADAYEVPYSTITSRLKSARIRMTAPGSRRMTLAHAAVIYDRERPASAESGGNSLPPLWLTPVELITLQAIADGKTLTEIAAERGVTYWSVSNTLKDVRTKLTFKGQARVSLAHAAVLFDRHRRSVQQ